MQSLTWLVFRELHVVHMASQAATRKYLIQYDMFTFVPLPLAGSDQQGPRTSAKSLLNSDFAVSLGMVLQVVQ